MGFFPPVSAYASDVNNALATATIAAQVGMRLKGLTLVAGYSGTPGSGCTITLLRGSTVLFKEPITSGGLAPFEIEGFASNPNEALSAQLSASGSAGVLGYVALSAQPE